MDIQKSTIKWFLSSIFITFDSMGLSNEPKCKMLHSEYPPCTRKMDVYKQMIQILEDGEIPLDMAPSDAYETDPIFLQHSEATYNSALHRWRNCQITSQCTIKGQPRGAEHRMVKWGEICWWGHIGRLW